MTEISYPHSTPALRVDQPLGTFYVCVLPASLLLDVASSDVMSATLNGNGVGYSLDGTQRLVQDKRLTQIAKYIDRVDSSFPNSIILAANFDRELGIDLDEVDSILEDDTTSAISNSHDVAWTVNETAEGDFSIVIPSSKKLAAIIDGQHRLFGFAKAEVAERLQMKLICAVFLDLPKPLQAQLFATINSTQKPVDRSLTFELFGYNVSDESENLWTPDKLAVFFARKLGTSEGSPLRARVTVAPKRDSRLQELAGQSNWRVSTAVVVDGILRLVTSNPKRDANLMRTPAAEPRSVLRNGPKDKSPLRDIYIFGNDTLIYAIVENYLKACDKIFWSSASTGSFIRKTVGVQALFDILRKLAPLALAGKDVRQVYFENKLEKAGRIDFSAKEFQSPSGSGRSIIRKAIESQMTFD